MSGGERALGGAVQKRRDRDVGPAFCLDLGRLFASGGTGDATVEVAGGVRHRGPVVAGVEVVLDRFPGEGLACACVRIEGEGRGRLEVTGGYRITTTVAGGWLLSPVAAGAVRYWIPRPPRRRRVDAVGRIVEETEAEVVGLEAGADLLGVEVALAQGWVVDWVVWQLSPEIDLDAMEAVELQPIFLWGSHTAYGRPADLYLHLIHGHVYENRASWPHYWKVCSENDAHALWVALRGLELATGRALYRVLRRQLLLSIIERQADDGGWYHGEWTEGYESHFRLHTSGVHLLLDALGEAPDSAVQAALARAVDFLAARAVEIDAGTWFLHDSLEASVESMRQSPFAWLPSRALGKGESNMLVLNTHLDTTVALARYGEVTGDTRYRARVDSACRVTSHLLALRPAEWLYRLLFYAIRLSFLPTAAAEQLPAAVRAVKRIGWKHLIPWLWRVKARYPRLVMPGGYIDRALSLKGLAHEYQSIHTMDLARYLRRFPGEPEGRLLDMAVAFTFESGLVHRWCELPTKAYALGFLAETLYHQALEREAAADRRRLARVMLLLEGLGLGQPPSLLGGNAEAVPPGAQVGAPSPAVGCLRLANLSRAGRREVVVVNPTDESCPMDWERPPSGLVWCDGEGREVAEAVVPAAGWLWGREQ